MTEIKYAWSEPFKTFLYVVGMLLIGGFLWITRMTPYDPDYEFKNHLLIIAISASILYWIVVIIALKIGSPSKKSAAWTKVVKEE